MMVGCTCDAQEGDESHDLSCPLSPKVTLLEMSKNCQPHDLEKWRQKHLNQITDSMLIKDVRS